MTTEPTPTADPRLNVLRAVSADVGGVMLIGAAALYLFPADLLEYWPWDLTPLTSRVRFGCRALSCRRRRARCPPLVCW